MPLDEKTRKGLLDEIHRLEELEKECQAARIALQKSEELCRAQFQSQDSIKLILNQATGEVIDANQAACDFFESGRSELLGNRIADITNFPNDRITELLEVSRGRINTTFQIRHRLKNGQLLDLDAIVTPITLNGDELLSCVMHDVTERVREKMELRESRQQLQTILDNSTALVVTRSVDGLILESNKTCEQLLGFSRDELLGKTTLELGLYPGDDRRRLVGGVYRNGHVHNLQFSLRRKDGTLIEAYVSAVPFVFNRENCLLTVINDVTERNRALEAQRISDERFQEALRCSRHVLYRHNGRLDLYDYISPCIEELTGYPYEEFRRYGLKKIGGLIHPEDREKVVARIEETGRRHPGLSSPVDLEYRFRKADGEYCWLNDWTTITFDEHGRIESMVGSVYDISDRKKAELELREREERLRIIFDTSHSGILMIDARGVISFANNRMAEMFGCPLTELIGSYYPDHLYPADSQACVRMMHQMIAGDLSQVLIEKQYLRNGGGSFWGYLSARRLEAEDGALRALVCIISDITARKQTEKELVDKNTELERFTYTVSHDLKSPLITIQCYAGMIRDDLEAGLHSRIPDDLQKIVDASTKMGMLLDDLLQISRVGKMMSPPAQVDMGSLVTDVLEQLAGPLKQNRVAVAVQSDLPSVHGDQLRIAEALQNLIENAIKYMGDQGSPRIEIGARIEGNQQVFFVSDNGKGIDPQYHESVFGLFNKLDAGSTGTGIGLALVKRIIEVHGGRVWVESEGAGRGSSFCFTFN